MSDDHPSAQTQPVKPAKPSPDFPLFSHATGRWAKKIKGKMHYFGHWDDPEGALSEYQAFASGKLPAPPTTDRTTRPANDRPAKPYPDFPLFPHATRQWAKKIRGRTYYFGNWDDPQAALTRYLEQKDALHAGRKPRADTEGTTIRDLCNDFLNAKAAARDAGELVPRSWQDYKDACDLIVQHLGKRRLVADLDPEDFADMRGKMAKTWGPATLGNVIQRMRVVFKYAFDNGLIDRPVRYGQGFKRPSRKTLRVHRAKQGAKLFTAEEVRRLIDAGTPQLRAMILLGINAGFGNADCGHLPLSALDLERGVIDFPRPKTGIPRRCILWHETVEVIREALTARPEPKKDEHTGLVFITKYGLPWAKDTADQTLAKEFGKLLRALKMTGRKGLGFYTLRHTFRTIADEAKDQPAADYIMGHEVPHMSSVYRETISDDRLKAVTDHVRAWLFPGAVDTKVAQRREVS
jgi:integrase